MPTDPCQFEKSPILMVDPPPPPWNLGSPSHLAWDFEQCTLHSPTHSGWTADGLQMSIWTLDGLHLSYNSGYVFHDHPPGVHLESA